MGTCSNQISSQEVSVSCSEVAELYCPPDKTSKSPDIKGEKKKSNMQSWGWSCEESIRVSRRGSMRTKICPEKPHLDFGTMK